jgi:exosortase
MLVFPAAVYLLWTDRHRLLSGRRVQPSWWSAIGLLLFSQLVRAVGITGMLDSLERYSLILALGGLLLLLAGRPFCRRIQYHYLFLFLMVPLPAPIHNRIALPLLGLATQAACAVLDILGIQVIPEGNTLLLNGRVELAVAEACSGLRMLTAFIVVAAFLAFLADRPRWQRVVLLASSVPVAMICNIMRLVATALLFLLVNENVGQKFFHDFAGVSMMPLAILLLMAELWVLSKLVVEDKRVASQAQL